MLGFLLFQPVGLNYLVVCDAYYSSYKTNKDNSFLEWFDIPVLIGSAWFTASLLHCVSSVTAIARSCLLHFNRNTWIFQPMIADHRHTIWDWATYDESTR